MIRLDVIGHLGQDSEMKEINGKHYISYSVAHSEKFNDQERTTWVSVMQHSREDNPKVLDFLKKGAMVYVSGNPSVNAYEAKDGTNKASLSLWTFNVDIVKFADRDGQGANNYAPETHKPKGIIESRQNAPDNTDLPF